VSRAIAAGLTPSSLEAKSLTALAGRGVQAEVDGTRYVLGNHRLIEDRGQCSPGLEATLRVHEEAGRTVSLLASDAGPLALFAVADTIKPSSRQAIAELELLGIVPVMLTGDNQATAQAVAREAGLTEVRGNLLPEDKLAAIQAMQAQYGWTAMVGDGINDAPALAQADIGVAMGAAGTDIAMEAADVVVMNDDLRSLAETVHLSRRTHRVLWQNITLALGIKLVFFVLAVFGTATMWMAVFADMGASLLVVANGLRLLRTPARS
jgi:Cd2+/Zn2+-exporting ATPase